MPRTNHLLQLVHQRVARLSARLESHRWLSTHELPATAGALHQTWLPLAEAEREAHQPLVPGQRLGDGWRQRWCRVEIPAGAAGRQLAWRCQGETTAWRDGVPWAGIDVGHPTCAVAAEAHTLWLALGTWQTGLWVPGATAIDRDGCRFDGCSLLVPDLAVQACLADLDILRQLQDQLFADAGLTMPGAIGWCPSLDRAEPLLRLVLGGLDAACDAFDTAGVAALAAALTALRGRLRAAPWAPRIALIAQSHIDLVYLWPENVGIEKAIHTCATQLRLLDAHPQFRFTHSQPLQYLAIGERSPALLQQIRQRIADGCWEVTGGFAVEPDTNLPCGEALFRSLRIGQRITTELTGAPSRVCWLPDVFGYNACLPALLRLAGIDGFVTTKMAWSAVTRFPWSSFVWRGHDGSEVAAHLIPVGYNTSAHGGVSALITAGRAHHEVHVHDELAVAVGFGDGGGGPNQQLIEFAERVADLAAVPQAAWSRADAFIDRLRAHVDQLPVHQGELYLEGHRGVLTSQRGMKSAYRALERALQAWEAVRVVRGGGPVDDHTWQRLCFAQFHDALPGSSIALVFAELVPELRALSAACQTAAATELGTGELPFNPLPFARTAVHDGRLWQLPALGTGTTVAAAAVQATPDLLDNGIVRARFIAGRLIGLTVAGEALPLIGTDFTLAEDHPANYDAWEIDRQSLRLAQPVALSALTVAESGPLRARLSVSIVLGDRSRMTVDYVLEAGSRHLRIEANVDWRDDHRLLRFVASTDCRGTHARFGCPFGSILRPQQPGGPSVEAQWEVAGSRWAAALRDDGTGIALLTADHYGFSCREGELGLSLLRAPTYPDPGCDRGEHRLRFAIGRHDDRFAGDILPTAAAVDALFTPPLATAHVIPGLTWGSLGSLVPAWVCPVAGDAHADAQAFELRLHEVAGSTGAVALPHGWCARPIDALGNRGAELTTLTHGPYAVLSLQLYAPKPSADS